MHGIADHRLIVVGEKRFDRLSLVSGKRPESLSQGSKVEIQIRDLG